MAWANWSRKPAPGGAAAPTAIGLDLNAGRARAAYGPVAAAPRALMLDDPHLDLPLAVSLEGRAPEVGRAGLGLVRRLPHLVCRDFLPALGQPREWRAGRHRLDPGAATLLAAERLRQSLAGKHALAVAVPQYLSMSQVALLSAAFDRVRLPVLGTAAAPLALGATADDPRLATTLVADVDDHAFTWTVLTTEAQ